MTIGKSVVLVVVLVALALGAAIALTSPPKLLDTIDRFWPGSSGARRVAEGVDYGAAPRQQLDIWAPKAASAKPLPVVVFFYGGAWVKGARGAYGFAGRAFAANGFIAVVPDYRLVPGVRYPAFVQDGAAAVRWVHDNIARYGGDPARITVAGHSAGAYIAAMLALDGAFLRDAGVDPDVVRAGAILAGPLDFYPWDDRRAVDAFANWPRPHETQPITYAAADSIPLLLAYGGDDTVVKPRNSRNLGAKLKALGADVELREYPGKSHNDLVMGLSRPFRGRASTLADSVAFLKARAVARPAASSHIAPHE